MSVRTENIQKRIASLEAWAKVARQHGEDAGGETDPPSVLNIVVGAYLQMADQLEEQAKMLRVELEAEHMANAMLELVDRFIDEWGKLVGIRPPAQPLPFASYPGIPPEGIDVPGTIESTEPCRACRGEKVPHTCGAGEPTAHKTVGDLVKNPWERTVDLERAIRRALHGCIYCRRGQCRADAHGWLAKALGESTEVREEIYDQDSGRDQ